MSAVEAQPQGSALSTGFVLLLIASLGARALAWRRGVGQDSTIHDQTISYLQHLRVYVYDLKREAESRARSLVTANALFVAVVGFVVKTATELHPHNALARTGVVVSVTAGLSAALIALVSLVSAVSVFVPYVADAASPMEPLVLEALSPDNLASQFASYTPAKIVSALSREIRAISSVQTRRSAAVHRAALIFVVALTALAASALSLLIVFVA